MPMRKDHERNPATEFSPAGFFMLRAPVLPAETFLRLTGDQDDTAGPEERRAATRRQLWDLAHQPRVRQALHTASRSLVDELARVEETGWPRTASDRSAKKKVDRAFSTLLRYLTRMSTRPTPYGLFSAVGVGRFGPTTTAALAGDPVRMTRTRADSGWLAAVIEQLDKDDTVRDELPVRTNALLSRLADRAVLAEWTGMATGGKRANLRITPPVQLALRLADGEVRYGDLLAELLQRFPGAGEARIRRLVGQLWELGVLTNSLSPPLTEPLPELHLLKRLTGSTAFAPVADGLRRVRALADAVDETRGRADLADVERLTAYQRAMTPGFDGTTYQVDTALATTGHGMPAQVAAAAAEAGELLTRLGSVRRRPAHIAAYHRAFLERYGANAEIPLVEVLSPELGIDAPNSYGAPPRLVPLPSVPEERDPARDRALVDLVAGALRHDRLEVELTDRLLDVLTVRRPDAPRSRPVPSLDVYFSIAAPSRRAIDEGQWRLVLSPTAFQGLQSFGRFSHLFDEADVQAMCGFAQAEEAQAPDVVFVELRNVAGHARAQNVATHAPLRRLEICVNATPSLPSGRQIPLTDILLGADGHGFYLRSATLGKRLLVTQSHALSLLQVPNVCRALVELSTDQLTLPAHFDWGPVVQAPFRPRLVRGRVVVSPAQWTARPETFAVGEDDADAFFAAVQQWRRDWKVPRHVYLTEYDNRLLLDLEHPLCVDELRRRLRGAGGPGQPGSLSLQEMLPDFSDLWLQDSHGRRYQSELVVPVLSPAAATGEWDRHPPAHERAAEPARAEAGRRWHPGEQWSYLKLYTAVTQQNDVLIGPVQELVAALRADRLIDRWFYIRYADPLPHLRLRFQAASGTDPMAVMTRCAAWARRLITAAWASDMAFVTYERELERYGGPGAIDAIEEAFHANSEATVELVRFLTANGEVDATTVGALALHSLHQGWGADPLAVARNSIAIPDSVHRRFRRLRGELCGLLAPAHPSPHVPTSEHASALHTILARQQPALRAAGDRIRTLAADGRLLTTEQRILESLSHMQANRLLGVDQGQEEMSVRLWLLTARALVALPNPTSAGNPR
ncbi:lantibiotic dehydratase [Nonomuraea sp. NPDC050451]|uniref:lantibiotic dehydratase n=1 Tax=Nonomuraea sp. NPDC050451 TaxID=3364364 RepID=UPI00378BF3D3